MKLIDADALKEKFADILGSTYTDDYAKGFVNGLYAALNMPTITPPNEPLSIEQLREMKDEPAYLKVFDPLLQSGWHIIKVVTEDKIIFREWGKVYVPIDCLGVTYNLYRRQPEGEA